ncbi:type II toxin-antitoxin system PemK/MazF family toxin [Candidatus Palauibacter sp.]|uniref:type II toxin-antitoxin system PemK/MazF family toxin n=1 Tax=Candidatus Palauibacter sp. TaxID=3101350 RepID=UPI003AF1E631
MVCGKPVLNKILPGEIHDVLDASRKRRPFIIVSQEQFNRGRYCLAVPLTSKKLSERQVLRNCVFFQQGSFGLRKSCVAQAEGLSVIRRFDMAQPTSYAGILSQPRMADVIGAIGYVMGSDCKLMTDPLSGPGAG